jgi:Tol biopolymer transport system component
MRLSFEGGGLPVWSRDGAKVSYSSQEHIYQKNASGAGEQEVLARVPAWPQQWSPDGKRLLYVDYSRRELKELPADGKGQPVVISATKASYFPASYSPDGKYISYTSSESGRPEVYVMAVPPASGRWLVSNNGGGMASWRGDGKELFYISPDLNMMAVDVRLSPSFEFGTPRVLFKANITGIVDSRNHYVVSGDGKRFLIETPSDNDNVSINVVLNWHGLLKGQ